MEAGVDTGVGADVEAGRKDWITWNVPVLKDKMMIKKIKLRCGNLSPRNRSI